MILADVAALGDVRGAETQDLLWQNIYAQVCGGVDRQ